VLEIDHEGGRFDNAAERAQRPRLVNAALDWLGSRATAAAANEKKTLERDSNGQFSA
jgi:hypothetical protein